MKVIGAKLDTKQKNEDPVDQLHHTAADGENEIILADINTFYFVLVDWHLCCQQQDVDEVTMANKPPKNKREVLI